MKTQSRAAAWLRRHIKNLRSGTSGFSRRWHFPAAKFKTQILRADSTGRIRRLKPSAPRTLEDREGDPKLSLAAEMLRDGGTISLKAWGVSMLPTVWPGDLLTVQRAAHDKMVPGDIVLVMRDSRFVIHRLIEARADRDSLSWITRGDAMPHNDRPVAASELLGLVVGISRANRSFIPSRRFSPFQSLLAQMLCRSDRFRNFALRIHAARQVVGIPRASLAPTNL
jgi:hypothetical protein